MSPHTFSGGWRRTERAADTIHAQNSWIVCLQRIVVNIPWCLSVSRSTTLFSDGPFVGLKCCASAHFHPPWVHAFLNKLSTLWPWHRHHWWETEVWGSKSSAFLGWCNIQGFLKSVLTTAEESQVSLITVQHPGVATTPSHAQKLCGRANPNANQRILRCTSHSRGSHWFHEQKPTRSGKGSDVNGDRMKQCVHCLVKIVHCCKNNESG